MGQMDMSTLIKCQRVCRAWTKTIQLSTSLQQNLFFLSREDPFQKTSWVYNPLLAEIFPSFFPPSTTTETSVNFETVEFAKNSESMRIFLRPEASWRRMLTTQPPIRKVGGFAWGCNMFGCWWSQTKAEPLKDGLRMGLLFETLLSESSPYWKHQTWWIVFGGPTPINAPRVIVAHRTCSHYSSFNSDGTQMIHELDLTLVTVGHTSCIEDDSYESDESECPPDYAKSVKPAKEFTWEKLRACYQDLGVDLSKLRMIEYNQGYEDH